MIQLHPNPRAYHACPHCGSHLDTQSWHVVGMRVLAALVCGGCGRQYFGDLPAGHGLYYPSLLEPAADVVHTPYGAEWFGEWLLRGFEKRTTQQLAIDVRGHADGPRVLLLNCLDALYGHALLKLLNVQAHLDAGSDLPIIVLVQSALAWLVPDGVAEVWVIDLPLRLGTAWNDWLDRQVHARLEPLEAAWLAPGLAHPHPGSIDIERFSRVRPFDVDSWEQARRAVTFVWREDRLWTDTEGAEAPRGAERVLMAAVRRMQPPDAGLRDQTRRIAELADRLWAAFPDVDVAVVGLGPPGGLPERVHDMRVPAERIDVAQERAWCERFAASHVVVGVHGSNMLLPSAHAGAVVDLVPPDRWSNVLQDLLPRYADRREALFHYRQLPIATPVPEVALIITSLLQDHAAFVLHMGREFSQPGSSNAPEAFLKARRERLPHLPACTS